MPFEPSTLESMCELIIDCPHSTPKWTKSGVVVLRNQNIRNGQLDLSSPSFTDEDGYNSRTKRAVPQAGDIVFTREAPMGEVCVVPEGLRCCLGQRQVLLRPKSNVCGSYLYWALQSPFVQHQISWNEGTGTTVSNVRIPVLKSLLIPRNGENESSIAECLDSLSKKYQLNHQINQTLEQMAQALFKSWFVDFEPVKAKIAARERWQALQPENEPASPVCYATELDEPPAVGDLETTMNRAAMQAIAGKTAAQLDALRVEDPERYQELYETAALFPSAMQESELGEVPEGWKPVKVEHFIELAYGKALKKSVRQPGDYPVYGSGGIVGFHNQKLVDGPSIIVGRKGTVGSIYWEDRGAFPIDTTYYVFTKNGCTLDFAFYLLKTLKLDYMNTDAAVPGLNRNNVYRIVVPGFSELCINRFSQYVEIISNRIFAGNLESKYLQETRDTLLPKLLSGELAPVNTNNQ